MDEGDDKPQAIVYRHADGYPDGLGRDLIHFCDDLRAHLEDARFNDPTYLAARWLVWDAARHQPSHTATDGALPLHPCDFLGVGIVQADPPDLEYRYLVRCRGGYGKGRVPLIICQKVQCSYPDNVWSVTRETVVRRKAKKALAAAA